MPQLIECVPNFSEGRNPEVIKAICSSIAAAAGALVLDTHMDEDHHRSVVTFVAPPESVVEAAFNGYRRAAELIDMTRHRGEHPRMGACDVCPLVPMGDVSTAEAVALARELAERVGSELDIPVYLYAEAASRPERENLALVRKGGYEGIRDRIAVDPERAPDHGPRKINLKAGATAIGVRFFLIAFNVFLDTDDVAIARNIARRIRESSGGLPAVKALGFAIRKRGQVQVSMNLTDYRKTGMKAVFDAINERARTARTEIVSSELVGLVPAAAMTDLDPKELKIEEYSDDRILENRIERVRRAATADSE